MLDGKVIIDRGCCVGDGDKESILLLRFKTALDVDNRGDTLREDPLRKLFEWLIATRFSSVRLLFDSQWPNDEEPFNKTTETINSMFLLVSHY